MKRFNRSQSSTERGFAMAALLIMLNVMAIAMTMLLPAWQTMATREREAELIFRGQQYARAVAMYQRSRGAFPPSIDVLVNEKFLRKKYKDPMTKDGDFQIITVGSPIPGGATPPVVPGRGGTGTQPGRGGTGLGAGGAAPRGGGAGFGQGGSGSSGFGQGSSAGSGFGQGGSAGTGPGAGTPAGLSSGAGGGTAAMPSGFNRVTRETGGGVTGPVMGVVSKSTQTSLRLFNGHNKYNEWAFMATEATAQAGGGVGGTQAPGGRGVQAPGMPGRGGQQTPGMGGRSGMGGSGMGSGFGGGGMGPGMGGAGMGGSGFGGRGGMPQGSSAPPLQLPGMGRGNVDR
jgi:type II secretory pathway pseudopilin PulG